MFEELDEILESDVNDVDETPGGPDDT